MYIDVCTCSSSTSATMSACAPRHHTDRVVLCVLETITFTYIIGYSPVALVHFRCLCIAEMAKHTSDRWALSVKTLRTVSSGHYI